MVRCNLNPMVLCSFPKSLPGENSIFNKKGPRKRIGQKRDRDKLDTKDDLLPNAFNPLAFAD